MSLALIVVHLSDVIDILFVAFLLYGIYNILKGTTAINLFLGIMAIYLLSILVTALNMKVLSAIINAFFSVGVIALIVLFQPEIRTFLTKTGKKIGQKNNTNRFLFWKNTAEREYKYNDLFQVVYRLAETNTGAIIIITRKNKLEDIIKTGEIINADLSDRLLGNLFFKNSPLHDGAVIVTKNKIISAGCILPVSENLSLPQEYGLRHRAAIGITEQTDAVAIIVSEERGTVSIAIEGSVKNAISRNKFKEEINNCFSEAITSEV